MSEPSPTLATVFSDNAEDVKFAEPWQAQAFAMVVKLHEAGVFTWPEWSQSLAAEIQEHPELDDGHHYYELWLNALEKLTIAKGLISSRERKEREEAWERAAQATPHGRPIELNRYSQGPETPQAAKKKTSEATR